MTAWVTTDWRPGTLWVTAPGLCSHPEGTRSPVGRNDCVISAALHLGRIRKGWRIPCWDALYETTKLDHLPRRYGKRGTVSSCRGSRYRGHCFGVLGHINAFGQAYDVV